MDAKFDGPFSGHLFINKTFRAEVCGEWAEFADCETVFRQAVTLALESKDGAYYAGKLDETNAHELAALAAEDSLFTLAVGVRFRQAMRDAHGDFAEASSAVFESHVLNALILFLAILCAVMIAALFLFNGAEN